MGRLQVFSRKYGIASDDLGLSALFIVFVRLVWLPLLAVPVERIVRSSCNIYQTIGLYVLLSLLLNSVMIVVSIVQAYLSFSGTVNNDAPRKYVGFEHLT